MNYVSATRDFVITCLQEPEIGFAKRFHVPQIAIISIFIATILAATRSTGHGD